jgi:hypothetical protein
MAENAKGPIIERVTTGFRIIRNWTTVSSGKSASDVAKVNVSRTKTPVIIVALI